jgi:hypothetical protein
MRELRGWLSTRLILGYLDFGSRYVYDTNLSLRAMLLGNRRFPALISALKILRSLMTVNTLASHSTPAGTRKYYPR